MNPQNNQVPNQNNTPPTPTDPTSQPPQTGPIQPPAEPTVVAPQQSQNPVVMGQAPAPSQDQTQSVMNQPTPMQAPPKKAGNKKVILIIVAAVLALGLLGAGILLVSSRLNDNSADERSIDLDPALNDIEGLGAEESAEQPEAAVITPNATTKDDIGHIVKVTELTRNFDMPGITENERLFIAEDNQEIVLVKFELTFDQASQFRSNLTSSRLLLVTDTDDEPVRNSAFTYKEKLATANISVFDIDTERIEAGKTVKTSLPYLINKNAKSITLRLVQPETRVIFGDGNTLPAKNFDVKLSE